MRHTRTGLITAGVVTLLMLSACGGGGATNVAPTANAGVAQTVNVGATVTLNGSASSDSDGTIASYAWTQTGGTSVTLNSAATAQPNFVAPQGTATATLTFRLIVRDNGGSSSTAATVSITVNGNAVPVANAGTAQTVAAGVAVTLNGGASSDADGAVVSYAWTQIGGGAVALGGASSSAPSFTAPVGSVASTLTFQLIVTDNRGVASTASTVTITVNANIAPVANAGPAQSVGMGATVTLNGSASTDPDGNLASFAWTRTAGPVVTLNGATTATPNFVAPTVAVPTTLTFSLIVTDNFGTASAASTVTITVNPNATVSGTVRFSRVPFVNSGNFGLDHANPVLQPARGVIVKALDAGLNVIATTATSATGTYSLTVPANVTISIQVVAQMQRDSSQPLPRWDVRVQNGTAGNSPYTHTTAAFSSNLGTQNIDIPTGIAANGLSTTGVRASGPFAILDTIYSAMQTVLGVAPTTDFPVLYVDWGTQTQGTFFTTQNGHHIALLADLTQDTDEFDQHVVAHEFGHYIERNFSRADNVGGSHSLGEKLDMRVAFGEGFGYAFAAIVLNDTLSRDSFVSGGTQVAGGFSVESNPSGGAGCWCSETSVWSILWDLYDNVPDGSDAISLPFSAIWSVLTTDQRTTPSFTTIFSFTTALKTAQPAFATLINNLVTAQNTNSTTIDAFATTETFIPSTPAPASVPFSMTLPLFPVITKGGGAVVVRSIDDGGRFNKAGNRGYLRFTAVTSGSVTVSLTTSNVAADRDPDFIVFNAGAAIVLGWGPSTEFPETETFNVTAGQTYIIDAYDCANGCSTASGTPGDYNMTVTIN